MSLSERTPDFKGNGDPLREGLRSLFGLVDSIKERVLGKTSDALDGLRQDVEKNPDRGVFGLMWDRVKTVFGGSDKKSAPQEGKKAPVDVNRIQRDMSRSIPSAVPASTKKAPKAAKKEKAPRKPNNADQRLKEALNAPEKRDWLTWAKEASRIFNVPVYLIFSIMDLESHLNPEARNKSGAAGLGQFMPKTAARATVSMKEKYKVQGLEGLKPCDPKWDFFATAWYIRQNADGLGFDPNKPDAPYWAYICHFQGLGGARKFRRGGVDPGNMKHYLGKFDSTLGRKVENEADYRELITKLANGVQKKSQGFKGLLTEHEAKLAVQAGQAA